MKILRPIFTLALTALVAASSAARVDLGGEKIIPNGTKQSIEVLKLKAGESTMATLSLNGKERSVRYRASSSSSKDSDKYLEFRIGGESGKLLAKVKVHNTNVETDFIASIEPLESPIKKGEAKIYIKFVGSRNDSSCNIDWIEFTEDEKRTGKSLVDFFLPMEPQSELLSEGIWGEKNVLPRDVKNGLEDSDMSDWCYWDGGVVKGDDGRYHLYCSRWAQSYSHSVGWHEGSKATHAVSDNIMGPYEDQGLIWEDVDGGKAHNVFGFRMNDGRYGVVTSEITDGMVFAADKPEGPFKLLGKIEVDLNGFEAGLARYGKAPYHMSNVQIRPRPEGKGYMLICRSTATMISEDNVLGPYKIISDRAYKNTEALARGYNEDPTMWFSGGMYHLVYNHWPSKISHHFTSKDGVNYTYRGEAYNKGTADIFRYTDGSSNKWTYIERPTAVLGDDGHVSHFIFSVIDVTKGGDKGDDNHGSKIVVVPFDGKAFDEYMSTVEFD